MISFLVFYLPLLLLIGFDGGDCLLLHRRPSKASWLVFGLLVICRNEEEEDDNNIGVNASSLPFSF